MLSLVGALPYFEAVLKTGARTLTWCICPVCDGGTLAVMGTEMVPPAFKPYDHNNLYATFRPVLEFIRQTMDQGVPLSYQTFPFRYRDGAFEIHFDGAWMNKRWQSGLEGNTERRRMMCSNGARVV